MVGVLTSVFGFSTGPCSVVGCGVPVLPVVGLAFTGLSTETLRVFAKASAVAVAAVLFAVTVGVAYLGWQVGHNPMGSRPPGA